MTRFAKKLYVKQSLKREYCVTETGWTLHGKVSSRKVTLQVCLSGQQEFLWKLSSTLEMCSVQRQVETSRFMEVIMVTTEVKINFFDSLLHVGCLNNLK